MTSGSPKGERVTCPECGEAAYAVIPDDCRLTDEATADGKVWVNCRHCGNRFLAYYEAE